MSCPARPGPPLIQSARPDPKPLPDAPASDRPSLAAWHAGWAVAVALLALGGRWIGGIDGSVFYGVLAMVVPGLSGLVLLRRAADRASLYGLLAQLLPRQGVVPVYIDLVE